MEANKKATVIVTNAAESENSIWVLVCDSKTGETLTSGEVKAGEAVKANLESGSRLALVVPEEIIEGNEVDNIRPN